MGDAHADVALNVKGEPLSKVVGHQSPPKSDGSLVKIHVQERVNDVLMSEDTTVGLFADFLDGSRDLDEPAPQPEGLNSSDFFSSEAVVLPLLLCPHSQHSGGDAGLGPMAFFCVRGAGVAGVMKAAVQVPSRLPLGIARASVHCQGLKGLHGDQGTGRLLPVALRDTGL